jgi:hypothetical protein
VLAGVSGNSLNLLRCLSLTDEESRRSEWTKREREAVFVEHLERRRGELAAAQWQAPGLTIAAQAFLLQILSNDDVATRARWWILVAGVVATLAALFSLLRLRQREDMYSDAIAFYVGTILSKDPRPGDHLPAAKLPRKGFWAWVHRGVRWVGGDRGYPGLQLWWGAALVLFIVADFVALCATS